MKKLVSLLISVAILFVSIHCVASASNDVKVILDGELIGFDVPAQIIDGRTMVPMRKIFEELGMTVDWNGETRVAVADKPGLSIILEINNYAVYHNAVEEYIDTPPRIIGGRTLVPVRAVSELAGANVTWDGETRTVYINSTNNIQYVDWNEYFYYYGEVQNGLPSGYGILYRKEDDSVIEMGKYIGEQLLSGAHFFLNGDTYIGTYGEFSYGTYNYSNGDSYTGEFKNGQFHGKGKFTYSDGSYHEGEWENGDLDGTVYFYHAETGTGWYSTYVDGELITDAPSNYTGGALVEIPIDQFNDSSNTYGGNSSGYVPVYSTEWYLFSNDDKHEFLGNLNTNKYDTDSIANQYGDYGSKYSSKSIFNEYGTYGSKYSQYSAFNEYATHPPKIVDGNGNFIGYLTANKYLENAISYEELIIILKRN